MCSAFGNWRHCINMISEIQSLQDNHRKSWYYSCQLKNFYFWSKLLQAWDSLFPQQLFWGFFFFYEYLFFYRKQQLFQKRNIIKITLRTKAFTAESRICIILYQTKTIYTANGICSRSVEICWFEHLFKTYTWTHNQSVKWASTILFKGYFLPRHAFYASLRQNDVYPPDTALTVYALVTHLIPLVLSALWLPFGILWPTP